MKFIFSILLAFAAGGALLGADENFVRVSKENPNYFELGDGSFFLPAGYNMCFPRHYQKLSEDECFGIIENHFKMIRENGGNYTRIWASHPFFEMEDSVAGVYNPLKIARFDRFMSLAKKYGVRVKVCLEHFRNVKKYKPNDNERGLNVFLFARPAYDGEFDKMDEYFESEKGRALFLKRFKVFADKYGNDPIVFGWELWNELNCVNADRKKVRDWQNYMIAEIRKICPKQMVLNSYGSFDGDSAKKSYEFYMEGYDGDVAQIHRYLDEGAKYEICYGAADAFAADAITEIKKISRGKPVFLAETGAVEPRHSGPWRFYDADADGIVFHDTFYTPFFSGSAGAGQPWHWDLYIMPHKLWRHIGAFSRFVKDVNPIKERFEAVRADTPSLRIYALNGKNTILAFVRDSANDWKREFIGKKSPRTVSGEVADLSRLADGRELESVEFFDLWNGGRASALGKSAKIALPDFKRSCGLKIKLKSR